MGEQYLMLRKLPFALAQLLACSQRKYMRQCWHNDVMPAWYQTPALTHGVPTKEKRNKGEVISRFNLTVWQTRPMQPHRSRLFSTLCMMPDSALRTPKMFQSSSCIVSCWEPKRKRLRPSWLTAEHPSIFDCCDTNGSSAVQIMRKLSRRSQRKHHKNSWEVHSHSNREPPAAAKSQSSSSC